MEKQHWQVQLDVKDFSGRTALHCAASRGSEAVTKMLLETWMQFGLFQTCMNSMANHSDPFGNVQFFGGCGIEASCLYKKGSSYERGAFNPRLGPRSCTQDHSNFVHYINSPDRYLRTVAWQKKGAPERWKNVRKLNIENQSHEK